MWFIVLSERHCFPASEQTDNWHENQMRLLPSFRLKVNAVGMVGEDQAHK